MNLASIIEPHDPEAVAFISAGRSTTYGELRAQAASLRGALSELGVERGDRVAMLCANNRYFVVTWFAALGLGAVAVPMNPENPPAVLEHEIATVRAKVVVVGPMARSGWAGVDRRRVPSVEQVIATEGHGFDDAHTFESLLGHDPLPAVDVAPADIACLLFTSGTAGSPRPAILTHGNLLANIEQNLKGGDRIRRSDVVFGVLPLFHVFGLNVELDLTLAGGASVVLVQRFDPATALDTIAERGVTVIPGAPPMWVAWAGFTQAHPHAFDGVRLALSGAAKLPEDVARRFEEHFGLPIREGYGLTEASPVVTTSVGVVPRLGSVGRALPGIEVRLVDRDGDDALAGDPGEVWVRGPNVFPGYWEDAEATARALTPDGWLRTGDVATADDDGFLYLIDRAKDLVIVSGFNVYPNEVEEVLAEIPGVREVAVVGVPHPHTGEAVKAYLVVDPTIPLEEEEVIAYCADHLARYKCPSKVLFVDELPKGTAGKVLRRALR